MQQRHVMTNNRDQQYNAMKEQQQNESQMPRRHRLDDDAPDLYLTKVQQQQRQEAELMAVKEKEEHLKTRKWREASLFGAGPETMTSQDYETVHDVRRQIWTSGFRGFLAGGIAGAVGSTLYPILQKSLKFSFTLEPKHRTGAILTLSALGMLLGASTTGKQNSWRMTDIYTRGATPRLTRYQKLMAGQTLNDGEDMVGTWGDNEFGKGKMEAGGAEQKGFRGGGRRS